LGEILEDSGRYHEALEAYEQAIRIGTMLTSPFNVKAHALEKKARILGFDHGVGHSLLVLCDAKAPHGKKWNDFKALENYLFIVSISLS